MGYQYQQTDFLISKAVLSDKWDLVSNTFKDHPELRTNPINHRLETPLMIAMGTNRSHNFVKKLLSSLSTDNDLISRAVAAENNEGDTALHYAAKIGNVIDAKLLLSYSSNPYQIVVHKNKKQDTPLVYATSLGRNKEMLEYLYSLTGIFRPEIPTQSLGHGNLLIHAIEAVFIDIALKLVITYPKDESCDKRSLQKSLQRLAMKPELFPTGSKLGFCRRLIYKLLPVAVVVAVEENSKVKIPADEKTTSQQHAHDVEAIYSPKKFPYYKCTSTWIRRIFQYLASPIKDIYDLKLTHEQTKQLLNRICTIVTEKGDQDTVWTIFGSTIDTAVEYGNYEVIEECIITCPSVIWSGFGEVHLFHEAIRQRREQVYNLIYQMSSYKTLVLSHVDETTKENALHIAAKLAPVYQLSTITGAALQMQSEYQWFEEIKSLIPPSLKKAKNSGQKTPKMVFIDEHKELLKEGKEWMKDTASSSTVVAALIVTVAFAAVFTLPGGDENKRKLAFLVFIISDATALFSSAISALLFLGILTSRYAEKDFLHVLPRRLMGGLFTLFLSLAATMITFSATLALVLQDQFKWIAVPLILTRSISVGLFVFLQYPLLIELVYATYGPTIFTKSNNIKLFIN